MKIQHIRESLTLLGIIIVNYVLIQYFEKDYITSIKVCIATSIFLILYITTHEELYSITTHKYSYWVTVFLFIAIVVIAEQQIYIQLQGAGEVYFKIYNTISSILTGLIVLTSLLQSVSYYGILFSEKISRQKTRVKTAACDTQEPFLKGVLLRKSRLMRTIPRPDFNTALTSIVHEEIVAQVSRYEIITFEREPKKSLSNPLSFLRSFLANINLKLIHKN